MIKSMLFQTILIPVIIIIKIEQMFWEEEANRLNKDNNSPYQTNLTNESSFSGTLSIPIKLDKRQKKFGKMIVWKQKPIFLSLGPDYLCFLPTFIIFCVVSYILIYAVFVNTSNIWFRLITLLICGGQCTSYFLMAISNPGVAHESSPKGSRLCKKCNIVVQKGTYHCRDCQICVIGYDHHCPWTSKCIGKNNLIRFYVFLGFTPFFLIFCIIATIILVGDVAHNANMNNLRHHATAHLSKPLL